MSSITKLEDCYLRLTGRVLTFSVLLRTLLHYFETRKIKHINHVSEILYMELFRHTVVGVRNVEQTERVALVYEMDGRPEPFILIRKLTFNKWPE